MRAREKEREKMDGKTEMLVMTQLGPALNFTTPEILWSVSEATEQTSKSQASYFIEG